ncbi:MAG: DUF1028 domain-containing protein [Bacillota bacterium]
MKCIATFSIVGRDEKTGELGIAVQSKFLAVGALVPWAKAGVGAIATQALANLSYGKHGLELLEKGYTAEEALQELLAGDEGREDRQIGIVDSKGNSAAHTGKNCFEYAGHINGRNFSCQGNILVSEDTVKALAEAFENTEGSLAGRLLAALSKAQDAGGDKRGRQSAALLIVKENGSYGGYTDKYIDLRVDDHPEPIRELSRLLELHNLYFNKTLPEELLEVDKSIAQKIQQALDKLGYYKHEHNGVFDVYTRKAFMDFCGVENFEERICEGNYVDINVYRRLIEKAESVE